MRTQEIVRPDGEVVRRKPRTSDLRWTGTCWQRWSGRRWTSALYSMHPDQLRDPRRPDSYATVPAHDARRYLMRAVEDQMVSEGATVVLDTGGCRVLLGYRRRVAHLLHLVLTVLTGGLWAVVWVVNAIRPGSERHQLWIDDWGHVWAKRAVAP